MDFPSYHEGTTNVQIRITFDNGTTVRDLLIRLSKDRKPNLNKQRKRINYYPTTIGLRSNPKEFVTLLNSVRISMKPSHIRTLTDKKKKTVTTDNLRSSPTSHRHLSRVLNRENPEDGKNSVYSSTILKL